MSWWRDAELAKGHWSTYGQPVSHAKKADQNPSAGLPGRPAFHFRGTHAGPRTTWRRFGFVEFVTNCRTRSRPSVRDCRALLSHQHPGEVGHQRRASAAV